MLHSVLCVVLSLSVLMPPGVCICGGGVQPCPNHPNTAALPCSEGSEQVGGEHQCRTEVEAGGQVQLLQQHRCPDQLPHKSSCPAVAPTDPSVPQNVSPVAPDLFTESVVVRVSRPAAHGPIAPAPIRVSAPPLFIAHCALLI